MPELPEVETTVRELKQHILGRKIKDVWSDFPKIVKQPKSFGEFKEKIIGRKIEKIWRRAKNIIIDLSGNNSMLIHQKLTGHLLVGKWQNMKGVWRSAAKGPLEDSVNRFLHLIFWLDDGTMLALSDLRKFAKVELWDSKRLQKSEWINSLGPEPLEKSFSFQVFEEVIKKKKGKIKQILMDQAVISGIGNIYSDEILWQAKVHPLRLNLSLRNKELESIYRAMKEILEQAIKLKGDSMSDYRLISGEKGGYQNIQKVYQQEGNDCQRKDGGIIKRIKIGGRSSRFCPKCQLLTNF
ncbi:MAG: DNA-formamidopyrimidine glycosylase [bacterium]|nr:DNA-formamidopyrimidine glycosylase [bacterium]